MSTWLVLLTGWITGLLLYFGVYVQVVVPWLARLLDGSRSEEGPR